MHNSEPLKLLFIINPGAGNKSTNWPLAIDNFFTALPHTIEKINIEPGCTVTIVKDKIKASAPNRVIAVGGDGTVKLVAESLLYTNMVMGILPAGSANGLAKELGIPADAQGALQHLLKNEIQKIHLVNIIGYLC